MIRNTCFFLPSWFMFLPQCKQISEVIDEYRWEGYCARLNMALSHLLFDIHVYITSLAKK